MPWGGQKGGEKTEGELWPASKRHRLERFANGIAAWKSGQSYGTGCRCFRSHETFRSLVIRTISISLPSSAAMICDRYIIEYIRRPIQSAFIKSPIYLLRVSLMQGRCIAMYIVYIYIQIDALKEVNFSSLRMFLRGFTFIDADRYRINCCKSIKHIVRLS